MLFRLRVVPHRVRYLKNSMGPWFGSCKRRHGTLCYGNCFFFALWMEHLTWVFFPACVVFNLHLFKMWLFILSTFVLMKGSNLFDWMEANFGCPPKGIKSFWTWACLNWNLTSWNKCPGLWGLDVIDGAGLQTSETWARHGSKWVFEKTSTNMCVCKCTASVFIYVWFDCNFINIHKRMHTNATSILGGYSESLQTWPLHM